MDQVRVALAWLKKHHFWVLSALVALIGFGCWWSAANKMRAEYAKGESTIKTEFSSLKTVRDAAFHPNATINERQDAETKKQAESVTKLWQQLYDRQREAVLKWPASLSPEFRDEVEKKQFNDDIPWELRNIYQNYIQQHFPELPKQIGARELEAGVGGPGGGGFAASRSFGPEGGGLGPGQTGTEDDSDYICEWLDQNVIREELDFPQRPSALRIWVTQEDLWVYHTLLDVIAKTNQAANATRMSNAAVKTVFSLEVGQRAAVYSRQPGRLLVRPATAAAGVGPEGGPPGGPEGGAPPGGPGGPDAGRAMMMAGPEGGGVGGAALSPAQEQGFLLSYRYLDDKGQPIAVGGGGAAAAGGPDAVADPAAAAGPAPPLDLATFGKGYKRLPIRMVLKMDGRWLPQLISTCANEPLRVEVQEVRINPPDVAGMEGGAGGGFRGSPGMGGGGAGASLFPDHNGIQSFPAQPNVVNVVIQGTIYIFNKPDPNILQAPGEQPVAVTP